MMEDRKKRLAALASRAGRSKPSDDDDDNNKDTAENDTTADPAEVLGSAAKDRSDVTFRNYTPKDAALEQKGKQEKDNKNKRSRDEKENDQAEPPKKKSALEEALEQAQKDLSADPTRPKHDDSGNKSSSNNTNKTSEQQQGGELTSMAPKKINWDLKRDIQPKLDKLERRTQKVIVQLLKERLAKEAEDASEEEEQDLD